MCKLWIDVYRTMKEKGVASKYLQAGAWMGYPVLTPPWIIRIINETVYSKAKVQMLYVMYKVYEMCAMDKRLVPLRQSQKTLNQSDDAWWWICKERGVPFRKTYEKDLGTPWT